MQYSDGSTRIWTLAAPPLERGASVPSPSCVQHSAQQEKEEELAGLEHRFSAVAAATFIGAPNP